VAVQHHAVRVTAEGQEVLDIPRRVRAPSYRTSLVADPEVPRTVEVEQAQMDAEPEKHGCEHYDMEHLKLAHDLDARMEPIGHAVG